MSPDDFLKLGKLHEAVAAAEAEVRAKPADSGVRVLLAQLYLARGELDRAATQAALAGDMHKENAGLKVLLQTAIPCEESRRLVFAGSALPMILGEPEPWMASAVQAAHHAFSGNAQAFLDLHRQGADSRPAVGGMVDGRSVTAFADADARFGPMLEAFVNGKYFWVPFTRLLRLEISPPTRPWNLVWAVAQATFTTSGQSAILLPARYPGSERSADGRHALAQLTEWEAIDEGVFQGLGQRLWTAADERGEFQDFGILDTRTIVFANAPSAAPPAGGGGAMGEPDVTGSISIG